MAVSENGNCWTLVNTPLGSRLSRAVCDTNRPVSIAVSSPWLKPINKYGDLKVAVFMIEENY